MAVFTQSSPLSASLMFVMPPLRVVSQDFRDPKVGVEHLNFKDVSQSQTGLSNRRTEVSISSSKKRGWDMDKALDLGF